MDSFFFVNVGFFSYLFMKFYLITQIEQKLRSGLNNVSNFNFTQKPF